MKTLTSRTTANPRRTTLTHLEDATETVLVELPEHTTELPAHTANPRRTTLMDIPVD